MDREAIYGGQYMVVEQSLFAGDKGKELLYILAEDIEEFITYSVSKIAEDLREICDWDK